MADVSNRRRQPRGQATAGEFAEERHGESGVDLGSPDMISPGRTLPSTDYLIGSADEPQGEAWRADAAMEGVCTRNPHFDPGAVATAFEIAAEGLSEKIDPGQIFQDLSPVVGPEVATDVLRTNIALTENIPAGASAHAVDAFLRSGAIPNNIEYEPYNQAISTVSALGDRVWARSDGQGNLFYQNPQDGTYTGAFPDFASAATAIHQFGGAFGHPLSKPEQEKAQSEREKAAAAAAEAAQPPMGAIERGFVARHGLGALAALTQARELHESGMEDKAVYAQLNTTYPYTVASDAAQIAGGRQNSYPKSTGTGIVQLLEVSGAVFHSARKVRGKDALQVFLDGNKNVGLVASTEGFSTEDGTPFGKDEYRQAVLHAVDTAAVKAFTPPTWKDSKAKINEDGGYFTFECPDTGIGPAGFLITYDGTVIPSQETRNTMTPEQLTKASEIVANLRNSQASHEAVRPYRAALLPARV